MRWIASLCVVMGCAGLVSTEPLPDPRGFSISVEDVPESVIKSFRSVGRGEPMMSVEQLSDGTFRIESDGGSIFRIDADGNVMSTII